MTIYNINNFDFLTLKAKCFNINCHLNCWLRDANGKIIKIDYPNGQTNCDDWFLTGTTTHPWTRSKWYKKPCRQLVQYTFLHLIFNCVQFVYPVAQLLVFPLFRGVASDAFRWDLWVGCALLAKWTHRWLCGKEAHGAGAWGCWPGGEGGLSSEEPQRR